MRLNRKRIDAGIHFLIANRFEVYLSIDGYYVIENVKTCKCFRYSNYALMRRMLTELLT